MQLSAATQTFHSFIHSFVHSFIHSFIHSFVHSLMMFVCSDWWFWSFQSWTGGGTLPSECLLPGCHDYRDSSHLRNDDYICPHRLLDVQPNARQLELHSTLAYTGTIHLHRSGYYYTANTSRLLLHATTAITILSVCVFCNGIQRRVWNDYSVVQPKCLWNEISQTLSYLSHWIRIWCLKEQIGFLVLKTGYVVS